MPFLVVQETPYGDTLAGLYRTQAGANAAAAVDAALTAVDGEVLADDIPLDAGPGGDWWVRDTIAIAQVNAHAEIQYGSSGKGFRLEFSTGALGTAGNGWEVLTGGNAIAFDAAEEEVTLPEAGGSAQDYLLSLQALSGTYQFTVSFLDGTVGTDDLAAVGSTTWQRTDGQSGHPIFAGGIDAEASRKRVYDAPLPYYTARAQAALAFDNGLSTFHEFVREHAAGVDIAVVNKVHEFLYQKRRALRMAFNNEVTIGGNAITLTDAQFIAWATFCRFGPLDTSAVTALGEYNPEGLFDIFERADDPAVLAPTGPITWVGLDVTQWAGGYPNRLNVDQIAPVLGTAPSKYLNVDDLSWLRSAE